MTEQENSELLSFLNILYHPSIPSDERLNRLQAQDFLSNKTSEKEWLK